jgi:diacylglycerol kinase family enzyme
MKHLFIINPTAWKVQGHVAQVKEEIDACFRNYPQLSYAIHVTRWSRDAVGYIKRFCQQESGLVRIYAVGGVGTLFEVVNGAMGLPNVQVACYPLGQNNSFARVFCGNDFHIFRDLENLVFADAAPMDVICCNHSYCLSFSFCGAEALAGVQGDELVTRTRFMPPDLCYAYAGVSTLWRPGILQNYSITLDDRLSLDGDYISAFIANQPFYGYKLCPGVDAVPNDGLLNLYLWRRPPPATTLKILRDYLRGQYQKWRNYVLHYPFKRLSIASDDLIAISLDGEFSYATTVEYEIIPDGLDFVCPTGTEVKNLLADIRKASLLSSATTAAGA